MSQDTFDIDSEIENLAEKIVNDVEAASYKDISDKKYEKKLLQLSDLRHTKKLFEEIENANAGSVCTIEKRAVIQALLLSTWLQRFYFIIRTMIMSLMGGIITLSYILYFGRIDIYLGILLSIILFVATLVITRLFDEQITNTAKKTVRRLDRHKRLRDFIINHM